MSPVILAMLAAGVIDRDTANRIDRTTDPEALRVWAEAEMQRAFGGALNAQQGRLLDLLQANGYNPSAAQLDRFWAAESDAMWAATGNTLVDVATETAILQASGDIADTFNFINAQTTDWVESYYFNADIDLPGSIPQLNLTSRTQFARAFQDWRLGELGTVGGQADGLPQLIRVITPIFGAERAERIAVTETTRIGAESQRQIEAGEESTVGFRVLTAADETVCPICGPLHNQTSLKSSRTFNHPTLGPLSGPPFHVRCRCGITPFTKATANIRPLGDDYVYDGPDAKPPKDGGGAAAQQGAERRPERRPVLSPDIEGLDPSKVNDWYARGEETNTSGKSYFRQEIAERQKQQIAEKLADGTGIDVEETSHFVHQWAETSNGNNLQSLEIQRIAADEFGTSLSSWQQDRLTQQLARREKELEIFPDLKKRQNVLRGREAIQRPFEIDDMFSGNLPRAQAESEVLTRKSLRSMYDRTQAELSAAGIDEVVLYRGIKLPERLTVGESVRIQSNALESWSINREIADTFAGMSGNVISARVPISRIFSTSRTGFGCLDEYEFVVMSSPLDDIVKVIK